MTKRTGRRRQYWTVILLYPDYVGDYGYEAFTDVARTVTPEAAVKSVRALATKVQTPGVINDPTDFGLIAVIRGKHRSVLGPYSNV